MSEEMLIDGKKLLPIKEVVGRTKYTRDYIAKLAREGEIVGVQVGRQWFIDEVSLQRFVEATELELQVRRRHLSHDRKREREVKEVFKNEWDIVAARPRYSARRGVVSTLAIIACGIFSGYALYTLPVMPTPTPSLQRAQSPLSQALVSSPLATETQVHALPISSVVLERVTFSETNEVLPFSSSSEGIVLLPTRAGVKNSEEIAALFSDPVEVAFSRSGAGELRLLGEDGDTAAVEFVTVPVTVKSEDADQSLTTVVP